MTLDNIYSSFVQYIPELITMALSIIVSIFLFSKKSNREREFFVKKELNNILKIAIEYPYLEDDKFLSEWDNSSKYILSSTICRKSYLFNKLLFK